MKRERKKRNKIIIGLVGILFLMTAGYAAFQTQLNISGISSITSQWDIKIIDIKEGTKTGSASSATSPTFEDLSASLNADLVLPGDSIEYIITIKNAGNIDAVLSDMNINENNNEAIKFNYSGVNINDKLLKGQTHELKVKIEYDSNFSGDTSNISGEINIILSYEQAKIGDIDTVMPELYVASTGNDTNGNGTLEKPYKTVDKAYKNASKKTTIYIIDDLTINKTINFGESKNITLTSYSTKSSLIRDSTLTAELLNVIQGEVKLENIAFDGKNVEAIAPLILISSNNATLEINTSATIKNGNNTSESLGNNEQNVGGAICRAKGNLIINDGEIIYNQSKWGGGIYSSLKENSGKLIIRGGTISYNKGTFGGALNGGNFEMTGGNITNNEAVHYGGAGIIGNDGSEIISIKGGIISNNKVPTGKGGAFYITKGNVEIGPAIIKENTSQEAGGILCGGDKVSSLKLVGGSIINNTATMANGGIGIYSGCTYVYKSGIVSGNTPANGYDNN